MNRVQNMLGELERYQAVVSLEGQLLNRIILFLFLEECM